MDTNYAANKSHFDLCEFQLISFNSWSLYERKHKVLASKMVCEVFHIWFGSFLLKFIFLFNKN